ncbi:MAG: single-stranded DNA-binding protein, partial [Tannerellaceae bacterium]
MRFTPQKSKVAKITVASGKTWKDKSTGEKKQQTEFHPVTAWNFAAELLEKYCKKGSAVLIEGHLSSRDF